MAGQEQFGIKGGLQMPRIISIIIILSASSVLIFSCGDIKDDASQKNPENSSEHAHPGDLSSNTFSSWPRRSDQDTGDASSSEHIYSDERFIYSQLPDFMERPPEHVPPMPWPQYRDLPLNRDPSHPDPMTPVEHDPFDGQLKFLPSFHELTKSISCNIIGTDDRVQVSNTTSFPFSAVVKLRSRWGNEWFGCSGAIIGRNFVLTAGHCIYNHDRGGWASQVIVIPGLNGNTKPFGETYVDHFHSMTGWTEDASYDHDIGIVRMAVALGDHTGTFNMHVATTSNLNSWSLNSAGYPGDFGGNTMVHTFAPTNNVMDYRICTHTDICSGQSGSPAWAFHPDTNQRRIVGVITGFGGFCGNYSFATRLTTSKYDWIQSTLTSCSCLTGVCCDGCSYLPSSHMCRPSQGPCDVAEYCTGASNACPPDVKRPATYLCRPSAGECDIAEYCTGNDNHCPEDLKRPSTHLCRAAAGVCDEAEYCTGDSNHCPPDRKKPSTELCRPAAGECDMPEYCTGEDNHCPPDEKLPAIYECRPAGGPCDLPEFCTGHSNHCPPDEKRPSYHECRPVAGDCDIPEFCSGEDDHCPPDLKKTSTHECRPAAGDCDIPEFCTGQDDHCPPDLKKTSTHECRPAAGVCDIPEFCTGQDNHCPPDLLMPKTHICRESEHDCDAPEYCDGISVDCPPDLPAPEGTVCNEDQIGPAQYACNESGECIKVSSDDDIIGGCNCSSSRKNSPLTFLLPFLFLIYFRQGRRSKIIV